MTIVSDVETNKIDIKELKSMMEQILSSLKDITTFMGTELGFKPTKTDTGDENSDI